MCDGVFGAEAGHLLSGEISFIIRDGAGDPEVTYYVLLEELDNLLPVELGERHCLDPFGEVISDYQQEPQLLSPPLPPSSSRRQMNRFRAVRRPFSIWTSFTHVGDFMFDSCVCVPGWFMDSGGVVVWIFPRGKLLLRLLALGSLFRGVIGRTPSRLFDLHVLWCPDENISHFSDINFHQMLVERR